MTFTNEELKWINEALFQIGVKDYRFCVENTCYVCDVNGNFYSVCHIQHSNSGNLIKRFRIVKLNGSVDRDGYQTYRIVSNGKKKHLKAHRLMMNAWIGEQNLLSVNHKDGNKLNNALSNLEWCTVQENNIHAIKNNLRSGTNVRNDGPYRIPRVDWITIYVMHNHLGYSIERLAHLNGCSRTVISDILNRVCKIMEVQYV